MKIIQIKASQFFELLKMKDTSMWEIFAQMIDGVVAPFAFADHAAIDPEDRVELPPMEGDGQRILAAPVFPEVDHDFWRLQIRLICHRISAPRP